MIAGAFLPWSVVGWRPYPSFPRRREGRARALCFEERWFCVLGCWTLALLSVIPATSYPSFPRRRESIFPLFYLKAIAHLRALPF